MHNFGLDCSYGWYDGHEIRYAYWTNMMSPVKKFHTSSFVYGMENEWVAKKPPSPTDQKQPTVFENVCILFTSWFNVWMCARAIGFNILKEEFYALRIAANVDELIYSEPEPYSFHFHSWVTRTSAHTSANHIMHTQHTQHIQWVQ